MANRESQQKQSQQIENVIETHLQYVAYISERSQEVERVHPVWQQADGEGKKKSYTLTIFLMAALEWLAAVEIKSRASKRVWQKQTKHIWGRSFMQHKCIYKYTTDTDAQTQIHTLCDDQAKTQLLWFIYYYY